MQTALLISVIVLVLLSAALIIGGLFQSWIFYTLLKGLVEKLVALDEATNLVVEKLELIGGSLKRIESKASSLEESAGNLIGPMEDLKGYNDGVVNGAKTIGTALTLLTRLLGIWLRVLHRGTGQNGSHFQMATPGKEAQAEQETTAYDPEFAAFMKALNTEQLRSVMSE